MGQAEVVGSDARALGVKAAALTERERVTPPPRRWDLLAGYADAAIGGLIGALLLADALLVFGSVVMRGTTGDSLPWVYELSTILLVLITFLGGATAFHRDEHIGMTALFDLWPERWRPVVGVTGTGMTLAFVLVVVYQALPLVLFGTGTLAVTGLSLRVLYAPVLVGCGLIAVSAAIRLLSSPRTTMLVGVGVLAVVFVTGWLAAGALVAVRDVSPLIVAAAAILLCMALGVSLAFAVGTAGLLLLLLHPELQLSTVPLQMLAGVNAFVMLALPFFIFTGSILSLRGISARLMGVINDVTGPLPGGAALSGVVSMYLFSGLSGAKIADVAAVAPILGPSMRNRGHEPEEVVAVLSASAAMGEAVPPSLAILILTAITTVSTASLFLAGLMPAAAVGLVIMALIVYRALRYRLPRNRIPRAGILARHFIAAIPPGMMPLIIFGGIIGGVATPIEASTLAVVYGLLIAIAIYRTSPVQIGRSAVASARVSGMLLFLLATTAVLVWMMTIDGVAAQLQRAALGFTHSPILFMLVSIVVLVVSGSFFEGLPAIVIFAPLLLPIAEDLGINPLHYSVVLVMAMGVGAFLPPLGLGYFATCALTDVRSERAVKLTLLYMSAALLGIIIVAAVPQITLVLPRLAHMPGAP